jgi:oxygen-independent coproporphyrinogen-3 oxidase
MAGVYLSYPFCGQKCTYCNFASGVFPRALVRDYVHALLGEIRSHAWRWTPDTLYLGGGTPSRMDAEALRMVLAAIPGRPWREATLEAAPGEITREKARLWREVGITRTSLGVQSFVQREIARTGRRHTAATVAAEVALLREEGIETINIDLIAGLPGQTPSSWNQSLDWVERLGVGHVSVYMLEVDEDSRLGRELLNGGARYGARETPDEEATAELYEIAVERLANAGIYRYEISNFARPDEESRHNLKYWRLEPYAGFGADAHSFDGLRRSQNVESAHEYVERWRRGIPAVVEDAPACQEEERFYVGLRLREGVVPAPEDWGRFQAPIARFLEAGLLERRGDTLRLTGRGVLLSNEVFQEFVGT